jgi:phospholipid/cholesterol/gamma-HCH transport system substrate-binding protein
VDPKVNYTAVGIYVILLSMILAVMIFWLSTEHAKHYNCYLIFMKESVAGLTEKGPVKFNGVDVGFVDKIMLDPENPQEVKLLIKVDENIPITKSTVATLMAQGITGATYLGLKAKSPHAPPLQKHVNEPCPVIPSEPSLLVQLNEALRDVTTGLRGMNEGFKGMSDGFKRLFTPATLASIQNLLKQTAKASNQFPDAMTKFRGAAAGLASASEQVKLTLKNSEAPIKNLNIAIQNLTDQTLPEIYQAAHSLRQTLDNVKVIASQMKRNPSVIIRGTQPLPPGPGE